MSRLDQEPEVIQLAADLGLEWRQNPVNEIVRHCLRKIRAWLPDAPPLTNVQEIEDVVSRRLGLTFEEAHTDSDLDAIVRKYVAQGDFVFAHAKQSLDNWTFAELFERQNEPEQADHYVAIIDCRGDEKKARRFFTRWHEVAHLLVITPRLAPPFNRDSKERCPIERMMDVIAGELGFYEPVFRPELARCVAKHGGLSYQAVEDLRASYCPTASFHATAIAAVKACDEPTMLVEARFALKAHEQRALDAGQTFLTEDAKPQSKLRVVSILINQAAKEAGVRIDRNMEVPTGSVIARAICAGDESVVRGRENLASWLHSDGTCLPEADTMIEASATPDRAIAIIGLMTEKESSYA